MSMKIELGLISSSQQHCLASLIGQCMTVLYRNTSLGRDTWKSVVGPNASLQLNCNMEGFNAECTEIGRSKARIGILGNEGENCHSCNSRIGFGTGGEHDDSNTCGNDAINDGDMGISILKL